MNIRSSGVSNNIFHTIKNVVIIVVILSVLTVISEKVFNLTEWKIIVSSIYGYSVHTVSLISAIIIFVIGFFVKKRVQRTERLKSEFVAVAAHRLRTPLSRIQWGLDELYENEEDKEVKDRIDSIKDTTKDTIELVNYLLDATEAEATSVYYDYIFENGNIEYIVRQVVANYAVGIRKKSLQVNISIETDLPKVRMDKERIRIVIGSLFENAIMYTHSNGTIDIKVYKKDNGVVFSIADTGIGISNKSLRSIFSKFFRTKEAVTTNTDSVGLALFIAKQIIKKHKGSIHVESDGTEKGSHFWFSLPVS